MAKGFYNPQTKRAMKDIILQRSVFKVYTGNQT